MTCEQKTQKVLAVIVCVVGVALPAIAFAQKSAGGVTGEARLHPGTWGNQRTSRSIRHSRSYARGIYRYSREADRIEPAVAKTESQELGRNIAKAQKDLSAARKEAGDGSAELSVLKSIEQHLASAAATHKLLDEECCKDEVDGSVCMKHCNEILLHLDKAQAEQDALIRSVEMGAHSKSGTTHQHP